MKEKLMKRPNYLVVLPSAARESRSTSTFAGQFHLIRQSYAQRFGHQLENILICGAVVAFVLNLIYAAGLFSTRGWLSVVQEDFAGWLLPGILAAALPAVQAIHVLFLRSFAQ
jgi:hypothetical protein